MRPGLAAVLLGALALPARAQTMLDQEERLIELHSLLLPLAQLAPPGALRSLETSLGLELVAIPTIDGTTGSKRQITASDRTSVFPRPRLALGLPAPEGFRAQVGIAYVPPVAIRDVTSHQVAGEAALAWTPGPFAAGLRGQLLWARSRSPVTDPATRDTLRTWAFGADLSAGWRFDLGFAALTPWVGLGATRVSGDFRVASDGYELSRSATRLGLSAGVRLLAWRGLEAAAELVAWPSRIVHPSFRVAWVADWGRGAGAGSGEPKDFSQRKEHP